MLKQILKAFPLLFSSLAYGQGTWYFPEDKWCQITNVSTANPAVVTLSTAPSTCGLTNGARIFINGVRGATIANVHLDNSGDTANRSRIVGTISGNTFTLLDGASANISGAVDGSCAGSPGSPSGNCAYTGGGRVSLAFASTRKTDPVLAFNASKLARLVSTSGSGAAQAGNPIYQKLLDHCTVRKGKTDTHWNGFDQFGGSSPILACALEYKISGDATALAKAKWDLTHPEQLYSLTACDPNSFGCDPVSAGVGSMQNYPGNLWSEHWAVALSLISDQLTGTELTDIAAYMLTTKSWHRGGYNYTGATVTTQAFKVTGQIKTFTNSSGVVRVTIVDSANTATVTTNAAHGLSVGSKIYVTGASDADLNTNYLIATVPTSTTFTITTANVTDGTYNADGLSMSGSTDGELSVTGGGTALTCVGSCGWSTKVAVGDLIAFGCDDNMSAYEVSAVNSNTSITISRPSFVSYGGATGGCYRVAAKWNSASTDGGGFHRSLHTNMAQNNGGSGPMGVPSIPYGTEFPSPYYGADPNTVRAGVANNPDGNAGNEHAIGGFNIGTALCPTDPRGCLMAVLNYEILVHQTKPFFLVISTGYGPMSLTYTDNIGYAMLFRVSEYAQNSWNNIPDMWPATFYSNYVKWWVANRFASAGITNLWDFKESDLYGSPDLEYKMHQTYGLPLAISKDPTSAISQQALYILRSLYGFSSGFSQQYAAPWWYVDYNHTWTDSGALGTSTTFLLTTNEYTTCASTYIPSLQGSCDWAKGTPRAVVSNTGTSESSTFSYFEIGGLGIHDHAFPPGWTPGRLSIVKNSELLLGGDSAGASLGGTRDGNSLTVVPNAPTLRAGGGYSDAYGCASVNYALRWYADPDVPGEPATYELPSMASGTNNYAFATQNLKDLYCAFTGVSSFWRRIVHLKSGAQDYYVVWNSMGLSSGVPVRSYNLFPLVNVARSASSGFCGTATSSSCLSLSGGVATNTKGSARINVTGLPVSSASLRLATDTGSTTNFSYSSGAGYAGRFYMCPSSDSGATCASGTSHTWFEVFQPGSTSVTMPTLTKLTATGWTGIQIEDGTYPKVFVGRDSASLTPSQTGLTITTTHSGNAQFLASDFASGTYNVSRNGSPVCVGVAADSAGVVECASIASGTITIGTGSASVNYTLIKGKSLLKGKALAK